MRHRFLTTDVCARLFCVVFLTYMGLAALTVSTTVPGRLVAIEGDWTILIFITILAIAGAVLVDVIVNSILPDRYAWQWVKSRRDLLYIISALLSIVPSWYMTKLFGLSVASGVFYLGVPILIFHLALCDIKAKYGAQLNEAR